MGQKFSFCISANPSEEDKISFATTTLSSAPLISIRWLGEFAAFFAMQTPKSNSTLKRRRFWAPPFTHFLQILIYFHSSLFFMESHEREREREGLLHFLASRGHVKILVPACLTLDKYLAPPFPDHLQYMAYLILHSYLSRQEHKFPSLLLTPGGEKRAEEKGQVENLF